MKQSSSAQSLELPYTLTNHKGWCMLHVVSMHRPVDPRQTAVSELSKVIPCLVAPKFEHNTLAVRAKQHNQLAIAAMKLKK